MTPGEPCCLAKDNVKTFSLTPHTQKFIQESLKQLATKKQQQVGNTKQIEDAAEKLKASGHFFLILIVKFTFLLRHKVLSLRAFYVNSVSHFPS